MADSIDHRRKAALHLGAVVATIACLIGIATSGSASGATLEARSAAAAKPPAILCEKELFASGAQVDRLSRRAGDKLGRLFELGRLLLETGRDSYAPGEIITFGLVNNSRVSVFYGEEAFFVQRWSGSGWATEEPWYFTEPWGWPWYPLREVLPPGRAGMCFNFIVREDQEPGRYRIVLPVAIGSWAGLPGSRSRSASFRVS